MKNMKLLIISLIVLLLVVQVFSLIETQKLKAQVADLCSLTEEALSNTTTADSVSYLATADGKKNMADFISGKTKLFQQVTDGYKNMAFGQHAQIDGMFKQMFFTMQVILRKLQILHEENIKILEALSTT